jgi:hypothetical protein
VEESNEKWTGSLEEDHQHALELVRGQRDAIREAMSSHMTPEQLSEYLEIAQDQFLELLSPYAVKKGGSREREG